ncbi:LamG-like jellyroll fold domain-containing protein [Atlantibacter sp.]|uniref:phage head spike fiber domain-containing protein n=1 Tax=Atlantibacter sp. TaxID=1903473 RepID=UPI0028B07029|nr:LamG-like jellyroll fold domain-containing protein [Atlantibacter sp.]
MSQFSAGDAAVNRLTAATDAFEKVLTEPEGKMIPMPVGQPQPSLAERLKRALDAVTVQPAQAAAQAADAAQLASQSAAAAAQSAADASNSAAATGYVAPPFPDVWAPLSDDLKMIAGYPVNTKLLSFTRASTATYIDKSGVLQTAAINEPRFEKEGLLIEQQSTNYFRYSDDPSRWPNKDSSLTLQVKNDGNSNAQTGVFTTTVAKVDVQAIQSENLSLTAGQAFTVSCRTMGSVDVMRIRVIKDGAFYANLDLNFKTGVITSGGAGTIAGTAVLGGDGYWALKGTFTVTDEGTYAAQLRARDPSSAAIIPVGSIFYVQIPQVELGTMQTSFIVTGSAVATRAADDCYAQRSGNDNYFGPVTIAAEVHCNGQTATDGAASSRRGILAAYPTTNDNIILMVDSSASTAGKYAFAYGSAAFNYSDNRIDDGQTHTVCSRSTTLQNQSCVDGTLLTSPTPVSRPTPGTTSSVNQLFYIGRGAGATASGSRMLNGHIRNLRIWHRALSDIQMKGIR